MELTGKCKEEFEKWLYDLKFNNEVYDNLDAYGDLTWEQYPLSMQWGVYVDYFDSVGIYVTEIPHWYKGVKSFRIGFHILKGCVVNSLFVRPGNDVYNFIEFKTRPEARTGAIEKANELRNETLNK